MKHFNVHLFRMKIFSSTWIYLALTLIFSLIAETILSRLVHHQSSHSNRRRNVYLRWILSLIYILLNVFFLIELIHPISNIRRTEDLLKKSFDELNDHLDRKILLQHFHQMKLEMKQISMDLSPSKCFVSSIEILVHLFCSVDSMWVDQMKKEIFSRFFETFWEVYSLDQLNDIFSELINHLNEIRSFFSNHSRYSSISTELLNVSISVSNTVHQFTSHHVTVAIRRTSFSFSSSHSYANELLHTLW